MPVSSQAGTPTPRGAWMARRRCRTLDLVLATDRNARPVPIPRPRETIESISRRAHSWLDMARAQPTGPPRVLTASLSGAVDNWLKPRALGKVGELAWAVVSVTRVVSANCLRHPTGRP